MECSCIDGGGPAGTLILQHCAAQLGRQPGDRLLAFYTGFRACLRARLSLAHLQERAPRETWKWRPRAQRYLSAADAACAQLYPRA